MIWLGSRPVPSEPVGCFTSLERAIRRFVHVEIEERSFSLASPASIEIERAFVAFLTGNGVVEVKANEIFDVHRQQIMFGLEASMSGWSDLDIGRPIAFLPDDESRLVCWRNPAFDELSGFEPISEEVVMAHEWMRSNAAPAFLLPALCYLRAIGCDRIFLTDGSRDEGIDCIGRIGSGGLRSAVVFVQAKSSTDFVSADQFSTMHSRYVGLQSTAMFRDYLAALEVPASLDGSARLFAVVTQGRFKKGAQELGWKTGSLLRSGRMLAGVLGAYYSNGRLDQITAQTTLPSGPDLSRNLAGALTA